MRDYWLLLMSPPRQLDYDPQRPPPRPGKPIVLLALAGAFLSLIFVVRAAAVPGTGGRAVANCYTLLLVLLALLMAFLAWRSVHEHRP
jgi:hypothetical protein